MNYDEGGEKKSKRIDPTKVWRDYENARDWKSSQRLYDIVATNEAFYSGDQWRGVKSSNLPRPVFNFIDQIVDVKVSTVMADQLTIHRKGDEVSEFEGDELVQEAVDAFNLSDKKNWERLKMDNMNEAVLLDSAVSGAGFTHWFWNDEIRSGNSFVELGDIDGEIIDSVNIYFSNPNDTQIQTQDWIIISTRKTVSQVRKMARDAGVPEEDVLKINGDEEQIYEGYDKAQDEQESDRGGSNLQTVLLRYWKEEGTVRFCRVASGVKIGETTDTELSLYPIAIMPWKIRKRFIYGTSEITHIIPNQQHVNKMLAMQQMHAMLQGLPKLLYNRSVVDGVTNQVGGIIGVRANPQDNISNVMAFKQPAAMSIDVDKSVTSAIQLTREFKGVNDNVLGATRPENTSAIIAQQRAAGIPLESVKRRFLQYIEDVAIIWMEFYKTHYNTARKVFDEKGNSIDFTGTDYSDIYLKTKIDVGASSQWSELLTTQILDALYDRQVINAKQYVERYPQALIPERTKLLEEIEAEMGAMMESDDDQLIAIYEQLSPEQQAQLEQLPEEEAKNILRQMAQQQGKPA